MRALSVGFVCIIGRAIRVLFGHLTSNDDSVNTSTKSYHWGTRVGESTADNKAGDVLLVGRIFSLTFFGLLRSVAELV